MLWRFFGAAILLVTGIVEHGNGARILGVFPIPSISHQVVFRGLTKALNQRGHELVVITTDPVRDPTLKNYTEIDFHELYEGFKIFDHIMLRGAINWEDNLPEMHALFSQQAETILSHPEVKRLYSPGSGEKFDLVLIELLLTNALLPLAKRFDAPIIGITSLGLTLPTQYSIGVPILSWHPSSWELDVRDFSSYSLWPRLSHFIRTWKYIHYHRTVWIPDNERIAKKYFGNDVPSISEMERNISLVFVNQQVPISFTKPTVPGVIPIGGFHISKKFQPLPESLRKILDEATQGFVYMSLGTNVKSTMLTDKMRAEFVAAFSQLPYKILWKFDDDEFPNKPDNVIVMKWFPQQAILAHPNLKVFVYQGGLQSTEEAISNGVPLVGIPVIGDQDMQVKKMVQLGVAKMLEIKELKREDLLEAIRTVTTDGRYKENMLNLKSLISDRPNDPLENAIWWTEHVIRHRGTPYLRSSTADDPWYRKNDMDIVAFITATFMTVLFLTLIILYKCIVYVTRFSTKRSLNEGKKQN